MYTRITLTVCALLCLAADAPAQTPVALSPVAAQQFLSSTGVPLASGCIYTSITGTSTPLATFTDGTGTAQNTNPVILDGGGFGSLWLSNSAYRFAIWSYGSGAVGANCGNGVLQRTVDNVSAYTVINQAQNIFLLGASSDPGGSAGELAYRTDIPCFRAFSTLWDCIVTLTATQTLSNKTLTSPTITAPVVTGGTFSTPAITAPVFSGTPTGPSVQGTDAKLLTSGTISGTSAVLCTDANGGATTSGCTPALGAAAGCTAIGPITITNNNAAQNLLSCSVSASSLAAGNLLAVDLTGIESTAAGQSIAFIVNLGGGTSCASFAPTFGVANNQPIYFWAKFAVLTAGAGGTGNWTCGFSSVGNSLTTGANGTVGAPTISINTTVPNTLLIQEQMSVANAGNSVTGQLLKSVVF